MAGKAPKTRLIGLRVSEAEYARLLKCRRRAELETGAVLSLAAMVRTAVREFMDARLPKEDSE